LALAQAAALEQFLFEEACRPEQTTALVTRAREFLRERRILLPADSTLTRIVGEQKEGSLLGSSKTAR
jgi:hypothetical protein